MMALDGALSKKQKNPGHAGVLLYKHKLNKH